MSVGFVLKDCVEDIQTVADALVNGAIAALPTETVYGLAAHALDQKACRRIFAIKGRPLIDPLIVHVVSLESARQLAYFNLEAEQLAQAFWPGPLTLVLPKRSIVPDLITAGQPSVAIRVPSHPIFRKVLRASGLPLAAPSANPFGQLSPTRAEHVLYSLGDKLDYIVDGGLCSIGIESTIVDMLDPKQPRILRPGAIDRQALQDALCIPFKKGRASYTPGNFKKHYSPKTRLVLLNSSDIRASGTVTLPIPDRKGGKIALVFLRRPDPLPTLEGRAFFWLSETGELTDVARSLFDLLHTLDRQGFDFIAIERPVNDGLGIALNDRLNRAAASQ